MSTTSTQPDSITMSGGGVYSLATLGAKIVIDIAGERMRAAVQAMDASMFETAFAISDMGAADAGTSMGMIGTVIDDVRQRSPQVPLTIYYTDQPRNDFNALIRNVHGLGEFDTYLQNHKNVYVLVSGTSFYEQMLPDDSLSLGFSATAMHWLSRKPGDLSSHVHMVGANAGEKAMFAEQAYADWRRNLLHRANELVVGGRLVLVNFCIDEQGRYLGNTGEVNMFDTFNDIWRRFVAKGTITEEEYRAMTLPQYYNTVEEFSAPFLSVDDPVYQAGLRLVDIETRVTPCPYAADFQRHGNTQQFADAYIPTIRTWNESTYFGALSTSRPLAEREGIIESFYDTYKQRVLADPNQHHMDYVHAFMTIEKV